VNNLFNQYYDVIDNFPMPGRSYRFTLQFTY
jgi:vitamin B12 transporter